MENGVYRFVRQGSDGLRSLRDGDFEEEDVWAVLDDRNEHREHHSCSPKVRPTKPPSLLVQRYQLTSAPRIIPRPAAITSPSSSGSADFNPFGDRREAMKQQSAPVSIPQWPKKKASVGDGDSDRGDDDEDDEDDDADDDIMAPHEYLARRQARSQMTSFSVFQGVGRKLRGRDLRQVRNAVLTKTGFLEH